MKSYNDNNNNQQNNSNNSIENIKNNLFSEDEQKILSKIKENKQSNHIASANNNNHLWIDYLLMNIDTNN